MPATAQVGNEMVTVNYGGGNVGRNTAGDIQGAINAFQSGSTANAGRAAGYINDILGRGAASDIQNAALAYLQAAGVGISRSAIPQAQPTTPTTTTPPTTATDPGEDVVDTPPTGETADQQNPFTTLADIYRQMFGYQEPTQSSPPVVVVGDATGPYGDTYASGGGGSSGGGGILIFIVLAAIGGGVYWYYRRKKGNASS